MVGDEPTHLVAQPGDLASLCGTRDPLPRVWERFAVAHILGHGMTVCTDCLPHSVLTKLPAVAQAALLAKWGRAQ